MLESLKQQHREMNKNHLEEMKRTKDELTERLEEKWKDRLKYECLVWGSIAYYSLNVPQARK